MALYIAYSHLKAPTWVVGHLLANLHLYEFSIFISVVVTLRKCPLFRNVEYGNHVYYFMFPLSLVTYPK